MGSGRILVIDHQQSIPEIARHAVEEHINQIQEWKRPCSEVLQTVLLLLRKVVTGLTRGELLILKNSAECVMKHARCDSVREVAVPILSGLRYFGDEFTSHSLRGGQQASYANRDPERRLIMVDPRDGKPDSSVFFN